MHRLLPVLSFALLATLFTAQAEVLEDDPLPRPKANTPANQPVERLPFIIDEPDFKATAVFPVQPVPDFAVDETRVKNEKRLRPSRATWSLPLEDGAETGPASDEVAESLGIAETSREDISPLLAKAIAKEKASKKSRDKDSIALYSDVVNAEPENAAALYRLGLAKARSGDVRNGVLELEKALNMQPKNPKYQCDFGLVALQAGWLDKAVTSCQWAAAAVPANARYQSALGDCFLSTGNVSKAASAYDRAWKLEPENSEYIHNLSLAHLHGKAFKKSIEICNEAIRMRPTHSPFYCTRGLAQENSKAAKEAIQDYELAVKLDRNNAYAHYLLASIYSDPDDPTLTSAYEAIEHANKAVALTQGRNAQYLMGLARACRVGRSYDLALDAARRAVALDAREDYKKELSAFEKLRGESIR